MAKFVYKMQSLFNIKQKIEEQEKTAYGLAKARLNEEENKLSQLYQKKEFYIEQKKQEMSTKLRIHELTLIEQAIQSTKLLIEDQKLAVKCAEQSVAVARTRLENAMKERKMQEKLREHALEQFKEEVEAEEQKEINELVTYQHRNINQ